MSPECPECPKCGNPLDEELYDKLGSTEIIPGNHVSVYCYECDWRLVIIARLVVEYMVEAVDAPTPAKS
jgi:hypothetical protein